MTKNLCSLIAATLSLATLASGGAAWADDSQGQGTFVKGTLAVQFVSGTSCASGDRACTTCVQNNNGVFVDAQGIAETTVGPLFAKVLKCATPPGNPPYGGYAGTLTLSLTPPVCSSPCSPTTPPSAAVLPEDVLTLTYSGKNDDLGDFYGFGPFDGTFTVENGSGKFQGAQGKLTFIAQSGPGLNGSEFGTTPSTSPFSMTGTAFYLFQGTIQGISQ
jgi:hypothetical protein